MGRVRVCVCVCMWRGVRGEGVYVCVEEECVCKEEGMCAWKGVCVC